MLDDQNGEALGDTAHKLHRVTRFRRTHAGSWLVEAEQCGLGCEGNADFEIALLAMRKIGSQLVALVVKADRFKYGLRFLDDVVVGAVMLEHAPAMPARLRSNAHVFQRCRIRQDIGDLIGARDSLERNPVGRKASDILAIEQDAARAWR